MKKNIIQSAFYLITISIIAKAMSFFVRILLARSLPSEAMNLYALAAPTMIFIITLAQLGIPSALSKVIAQSKVSKHAVKAAILLSCITNIIVALAFLVLIPFLSHHILKQDHMQDVLYAILPLIPVVSLSGILKGYLYGKQYHISATASQLWEEGARIAFLLFIWSNDPQMDIIEMAQMAMLSISVGEIASSIFMGICIWFKKRSSCNIKKSIFHVPHTQLQEILSISLPMTGSRFIGSLTYFLEPICMMLAIQQASGPILVEAYGQLNGYVLPILTMPSFLTITLSNVLLPSFTYHYTHDHIQTAKRQFNTIILLCFLIGIVTSGLCFFFPEQIMQFFYHSSDGASLLQALAWPFALYTLQPPLASMLHALSRSTFTVIDTTIGCCLRLFIVTVLSSVFLGNALAIALTIGMLATTFLHAYNVAKALHQPSSFNER